LNFEIWSLNLGVRPLPTAVIIPALNEAGNIAEVIREARAQPVQRIIVVDNGSTDNTAEVARRAGAEVVHEPRRGYGYACAAGVAAAEGADLVAFLDGDGSFLPSELPRLLEPFNRGDVDLVMGSRVLGHVAPGAMPLQQRFGNWLGAALWRWLYGLRVTDLGPYRAVRRDLILSLDMREMTFGYPTEMAVKAARRHARILEVPVSFHPRRSGHSKVSGTVRGTVLAGYHILNITFRYAR
jgi:glycosyltransferase involved in cell wall biosynthesis